MRDVLDRIERRRKQLGLSEQALSVKAGLSKDGIRNWRRRLNNGDESAGANATSISKVAAALDVSEIWLMHGIGDDSAPTVTIAGRVGAGARVPVFDAYEKGDGPQVEVPPQLPTTGIVAVEIVGDSMEPVYSAGDILFYSRFTHDGVPAEAIGRRCVCEDADGNGWVKVVRAGRERGTFDLHSFNDTSPPMYGIMLKWAAPVRLHWPAELARKK